VDLRRGPVPAAVGAASLDLVPGSHRITFLAAEGTNKHCQPMARQLTHERMFAWLDQQLATV
jgi:hypothetical protein